MRVDEHFSRLWDNADSLDERLARSVMAGDLTWLEAGVVDGSEGTGPWIAAWSPGPSKAEDLSRRYRESSSDETTGSAALEPTGGAGS